MNEDQLDQPLKLSGFGPVEIRAAKDEDGKKRNPRFRMAAYTGAPILQWFSMYPIVVDLDSLDLGGDTHPILLEHDPSKRVGHSTRAKIENGEIVIDGEISSKSDAAAEVVADGLNGYPWQASINANGGKYELIAEEEYAEVNGRRIDGPARILRNARLGEISFVALGADDKTAAMVAATATGRQENITMPNEKTQDAATEPVKAGDKKTDEVNADEIRAAAKREMYEIKAARDEINQLRQDLAEQKRVAEIEAAAARVGASDDIKAKAVAEKWDADRLELETLRASRSAEIRIAPSENDSGVKSETVVEAALMLKAGSMSEDEAAKAYGERCVDRARKMREITLKEVHAMAANWAGNRLSSFERMNARDVIRAAASSQSLTNILGNVANKSMLRSFEAAETVFGKICRMASVSNFQTVTRAQMSVGGTIQQVGQSGELQHGEFSEDTYTNSADTYGLMATLTRTDIVNDDLGAFTKIPTEFGRRMATFKDKKCIEVLLGNSGSFFDADNSNYVSGSSYALSFAGLKEVRETFRKLKDANDEYILVRPKYLLVPPALESVALRLMQSELLLEAATAGSPTGERNPYQGLAEVIVAPWLEASSGLTSASDTGYYLLGDPNAGPAVLEMVHLNGVTVPVIESADDVFSALGRSYRMYHDFGVTLAEEEGGVWADGTD